MKKIVDTTCPECNKLFKTEVDLPESATLDQIQNALNETLKDKQGISPDDLKGILQEQLSPLKPVGEDHRHKTADEFLDCPECRQWFDKTAEKYTISSKEPAATDKEPEPEPQMFRSIFKEGD
ncbi:hypothetical protein ES703_15813 [subsurface metagenome]